jgi:hypothetical protein
MNDKKKYLLFISIYRENKNMYKNIITISAIAAVLVLGATNVFAQSSSSDNSSLPFQEEIPSTSVTSEQQQPPTIKGKITIPISISEQIIIDLPISPDSKIEIVPIE